MSARAKASGSSSLHRLLGVTATLALAAMAACSGGEGGAGAANGAAASADSAARTASPPVRIPDSQLGGIRREDLKLSLPWTRGTIHRSGPDSAGSAVASVRSVSYSQVGGVDRMTVELDSAGPYPGYEVASSVSPLPRCASPDSIPVGGAGLLKVEILGARADSATAGPSTGHPDLDNVSTVYRSCLRPDTVAWVMDVQRATYYRVLEAANPPRLVVDVMQRLEGSGPQK